MKIVIGYLYYDLMNLYGDSGNINVIKYHLKKQGIDCEAKKLSTLDDINFEEFDMLYIGSSTEENRKLCLKHLMNYKKDIKNFIDSNKFVLITGNALGLFGRTLDKENALGMFDFEVTTGDRIVKEIVTKCSFCNNDIYGFMNTSDSINYGNVDNLFDNEGIVYNNFYGTYMIGPLLVRNYDFTLYFIKKLILSKDSKFKFKKFDFELDKKAYFEFIEFKRNKIHIR